MPSTVTVTFFAESTPKLTATGISLLVPNSFCNCLVPCAVENVDEGTYQSITTKPVAHIEELIEAGIVTALDGDQLPLVIAVLQGKIDVLEALIKDLKSLRQYPNGRVLVEAVGVDNADMVWILLNSFKDETDWYPITASITLNRAAQLGSLNVANRLLEPDVGISTLSLELVLKHIDEDINGSNLASKSGKIYTVSTLSRNTTHDANRNIIRKIIASRLAAAEK